MAVHAPADYELAAQGEPMPPPSPLGDVRPEAQSLTVTVRRVVQARQYEPVEVVLSMTAIPDPHYKVSESFDRVFALLETRLASYLASMVPEGHGEKTQVA